MKRLLSLSCSILFLFCCVAQLFAAEQKKEGFSLKSLQPNGWTFEDAPDALRFETIQIENKPHIVFSGGANLDGVADPAGEPALPMDVLTLGVPLDASLHVELIDAEYQNIENQLVAPHPMYVRNDNDVIAEYRKSEAAYAQNRFFPSRLVVADPPTMLRDQRIASVRISSYQYNPATKILRRLVRGTLRVSLRGANGATLTMPLRKESFGQPSAPAADPFFEETYRSVIWNYEQAKGWRARGELHRDRPADPTRDWFETGRAYYKIPITDDGWYKVTKTQLDAAGASQFDLPTMRLYYKGAQIPIVVRPDTSIEFYGLRNHGDSTWTDFFTDTSAYWLTWGGTIQGLRFAASFVDSVPPISNVQNAYTTTHFEQNGHYFQGVINYVDIVDIETTPGEGWAWGASVQEEFFPNTTREFQFTLSHADTLTTQQASLRVRLVSATAANEFTPNHKARFWINDSLAGEVTFPGRTSAIFSGNIPRSWLRNGLNVLKIMSVQTPNVVNRFYLDWFETDYVQNFRATDNQLFFAFPPPNVLNRLTFATTGFFSPQIEVFDLQTKRMITSTRVTTVGGTYSLTFRDSLSTPRSYVVVAPGGARPVSSVTQKFFTDIRANAQGADYIIITHRLFISAAQRLAAHRQTVNGVRTKVVDVQDIYDEFNYGVFNATKIKPFVKYAYDTWAAPRPSYLVFLGDASWDYHRFDTATIHTNYVPSYGVPSSDNWFVCFNSDTTSLPFLFVGRVPVQSVVQAQQIIQKIIEYDSYSLSEWNKNFLFVSGYGFGGMSDGLINRQVLPSPIGGTPLRVVKTTRGPIDGEYKAPMKEYVRNGVVFFNFIGHSGGRVWEVDIGPPSELENTDGKLPFLGSVSCNVGAFSDPISAVLAEDFILADNRGSIASWSSSTLGFPYDYSVPMVEDFLLAVRDSARSFGALTTIAKIKLVRREPFTLLSRTTVHTNNLLGDPLSRLALPLKPDFAITTQHITPNNPTPTTNDTSVAVKVKFFNYGLVAPESVAVSMTDTYSGQTTALVTNKKLGPTRQVDSLTVQWREMEKVGLHTLSVSLDPENRINEVSELNNIASRDQYVYANFLSVIKPVKNMVVQSGPQRLVVSNPIGVDSAGFTYVFELDTVDTFDSPSLISSGPIAPGAVTGEWTTPSLTAGNVYFWRARAMYGQTLGTWVVSSFVTARIAPVLPTVRIAENHPKQFRRDVLDKAAVTDTGVTIASSPPTNIFVRSVGGNHNPYAEYYSIIRINEQKITGYNFEVYSFMVVRINDFDGTFEYRAFEPARRASDAQLMADYINATPVGNYVLIATTVDGSTNVSKNLQIAIMRLGSTLVRQIQPGWAWAFIGRKGSGGPGMPPLEQLSSDSAVVSFQFRNIYRNGNGSITSSPVFITNSWNAFQWRSSGAPATNARIAFLGVRQNGAIDTLRILPKDSTDVNLSFLNSITSGSRYSAVQTSAILSTADALVTPSLREWSMDLVAPADLAISARTITGDEPASTRNIEVTVHNIGYQDSDSSNVILSVYDRQNRARQVASVPVLPITVENSRTMIIPISTANLPRRATLQVTINPAKKAKDLVLENNTAYYSFTVPPSLASNDVQVYSNGIQIMDGDFVPATPIIVLNIPKSDDEPSGRTQVELLVDDRPVGTWASGSNDGMKGDQRPTFTPQLSDGTHQLKFRVGKVNSFGEADSLEHTLSVQVSQESRIMQMYNYPNPFRQDTYFTFMLSGSKPPEELRIRIFTVSGRKIREIDVTPNVLQIGFNRVYWDGRDADGDEVANGYYFYQVSLSSGDKTITSIEKLAKVK